MEKKLRNFISEHKLFTRENTLLIAVSGGVDSVVLAHLLRKTGFSFAIAHCNYGLRGSSSEKDEAFVRRLASELEVDSFFKTFQTEAYAEKEKVSIQMAARRLRYEWFSEVMEEKNHDFLATAHHKNDVAETVLYNLARGAGLGGLHGIFPKKGDVTRPLLFADKNEILSYARENNIAFREDRSNASLKYHRNRIRNKVIPELEKINPAAVENICKTTGILRSSEDVLLDVVRKKRAEVCFEKAGKHYFEKKKIRHLNEPLVYLYHWLSAYGFSFSDVKDVLGALDSQPGKQFKGDGFRMISDREHLIVAPEQNSEFENKERIIEKGRDQISEPIKLSFSIVDRSELKGLPSDPSVACLNYDKIQFPLKLRKWKPGDYFYPLGMKGKKKLSDFFIDEKISLDQKENTFLLLSRDDCVLWVVGLRIDNRYRLRSSAEKVFLAKITEF